MKQAAEERIEQGQSGMSLIEVVVSLTMLGIVLVALGQGLTLGIRLNTDSKARILSLNLCKKITESLKSKIQFSQAVFDGANENGEFGRVFYADPNGEEVVTSYPSTAATPTEAGTTADANTQTNPMADASYRVTAVVDDWKDEDGNTLSATDANGVTHVLVKTLVVKVVPLQSAAGSTNPDNEAAREITLSVEMVRPAS